MIKKFGIQAWTVRDLMPMGDAATTAETFKKLSEYGYSELQTIWLTLPAEEYAKLAHDNGISVIGTHFEFDDMIANPEKTMETHNILGAKCIGIGGMPKYAYENRDSLLRFCESVNKFAAIINKQGFRFTYHNHSTEFKKISETETMMDILFANLDPVTTSFCLDTYWVQHGGGDVRYWIEKLSGRIDILHLKDMKMGLDGVQAITSIGDGNLYFKGIVEAAEKAGVKHYIVEQDTNFVDNDPLKASKNSAEYIKANLM